MASSTARSELRSLTRPDDRIPTSYTSAFKNLIYWQRDKRFDVENRRFLPAILESNTMELTLKCGRQVGKSTAYAGLLWLHGMTNPGYGHLYVVPRGDQAKTFSRIVFGTMGQESPVLAKYVPEKSAEAIWQISEKKLRNSAYFYFLSAYHTPDAIRGRTAGQIVKDEIQDLVSDHFGPIDECAANYPDARFFNSGTPKSFQNPLELKWLDSTQAEWLIHCRGCNARIFQDHKIFGKDGYVCPRCGKPVAINDGQWVMMAPHNKEVHHGFRITQMMNPNSVYPRLKRKLEKMPFAQFNNEVLGLSFAEGDVVLTHEDMIKACNPAIDMFPAARLTNRIGIMYGGVDHGTGNLTAKRLRGQSETSFTVVCVGGFDPNGNFQVVYLKKFTGPESDLSLQPALIDTILRSFNVARVFADWGFGAANNRRIINEFGWNPSTFVEIQESDASQRFLAYNNAALRCILNRTEGFMKLINDIKEGHVLFPRVSDMEPFFEDFTSIYLELNARTHSRRYDHTSPDDAFHATMFCYLAALEDAGILSRYHMDPTLV